MKSSKLVILLGVLIASVGLAQVYKWVDEEGCVHFGDHPPGDCVFEEVELQEGPTEDEIEAAQEKLRKTLESRRAQEVEASKRKESELLEKQPEEQLEAEQLELCVEAIYQLELLNQKRRVFRFLSDGTRLYLENEDRPNEISRLNAVRDEFCRTDPRTQDLAMERANDLGVALSRRCAAAQETLEKLQQPGANPEADKLERYLEFVEAFCPDTESDDLWLGDWIILRKRR